MWFITHCHNHANVTHYKYRSYYASYNVKPIDYFIQCPLTLANPNNEQLSPRRWKVGFRTNMDIITLCTDIFS